MKRKAFLSEQLNLVKEDVTTGQLLRKKLLNWLTEMKLPGPLSGPGRTLGSRHMAGKGMLTLGHCQQPATGPVSSQAAASQRMASAGFKGVRLKQEHRRR